MAREHVIVADSIAIWFDNQLTQLFRTRVM
jgi:hypothetical protein